MTAAFFRVEQGEPAFGWKSDPCNFSLEIVVRLGLGVFITAGILSENSQLVAHPTAKAGSFQYPRTKDIFNAPLHLMWVLFLFVLVVQRDLGSAVLYYALFAYFELCGQRSESVLSPSLS